MLGGNPATTLVAPACRHGFQNSKCENVSCDRRRRSLHPTLPATTHLPAIQPPCRLARALHAHYVYRSLIRMRPTEYAKHRRRKMGGAGTKTKMAFIVFLLDPETILMSKQRHWLKQCHVLDHVPHVPPKTRMQAVGPVGAGYVRLRERAKKYTDPPKPIDGHVAAKVTISSVNNYVSSAPEMLSSILRKNLLTCRHVPEYVPLRPLTHILSEHLGRRLVCCPGELVCVSPLGFTSYPFLVLNYYRYQIPLFESLVRTC